MGAVLDAEEVVVVARFDLEVTPPWRALDDDDDDEDDDREYEEERVETIILNE